MNFHIITSYERNVFCFRRRTHPGILFISRMFGIGAPLKLIYAAWMAWAMGKVDPLQEADENLPAMQQINAVIDSKLSSAAARGQTGLMYEAVDSTGNGP